MDDEGGNKLSTPRPNWTPPWKPGTSGNPNGRPKLVVRVRDLAREQTEKAIATLVECLDAKDGRVRVQAACALLDRAWGKPTQSIQIEREEARELRALSREELMEIARVRPS